MRSLVVLLALTLPALVPVAAAADDVPFYAVSMRTLASDAPTGMLTLVDAVPGERYVWNVSLDANYTAIQFELDDVFNVTNLTQVRPTFETDAYAYPLFELFPGRDVRDVDSIARVYRFIVGHWNANDTYLELGLPGAAWYNRTGTLHGRLTLERDVTPPRFESAGAIQNLTALGFYRETRTDELALVDLQVRPAGTDEWVRNPTTVYHVLQRFPVQGLAPERDYEMRLVATDWSGNENATPIETFRTPPAPALPTPRIEIVQPAPNATLADARNVTLEARIDLNTTSTARPSVRLFLDKREVPDGWTFENGTLRYVVPTMQGGLHSWSVEARNAEGGDASARGSFTVRAEAPGPGVAWLVALLALTAWGPARPRRASRTRRSRR